MEGKKKKKRRRKRPALTLRCLTGKDGGRAEVGQMGREERGHFAFMKKLAKQLLYVQNLIQLWINLLSFMENMGKYQKPPQGSQKQSKKTYKGVGCKGQISRVMGMNADQSSMLMNDRTWTSQETPSVNTMDREFAPTFYQINVSTVQMSHCGDAFSSAT